MKPVVHNNVKCFNTLKADLWIYCT